MLIEMENYFDRNSITNVFHPPSYFSYGFIEPSEFRFNHTPYHHLSSPNAPLLNYNSPSSSPSMESLSNSSSSTTFNYEEEKGFRRVSVIVKAENCRTKRVPERKEERRIISLEHVCRWENCYR